MRTLVISILLISGFRLNAESGRLLGAIEIDASPVFLVSAENTVTLERRNGSALREIPDCLLIDVMEGDRWLSVERTEDRCMLRIRKGLEILESVEIPDANPLLGLIGTAGRIPLSHGDLVLIPGRVPELWNRKTDAGRVMRGLYRYSEHAVLMDGLSHMQEARNTLFIQAGDIVEAINRENLKSMGSVTTDERLLDVVRQGRVTILRLTGGRRILWDPDRQEFEYMSRVDEDRDALVFDWRPMGTSPLEVRVALDDMGLFDALSAWKKGRLEAHLTVRSGEDERLNRKLVFSVRDVGNFEFQVLRLDGAVQLRFREKTEVLVFREGIPVVVTVDSEYDPVVYKGRVFVKDDTGIREVHAR